MEEEKGPKKVTFDKKALSSANKNKIDFRKEEVRVPELNIMMGLKEDEVAVMVVRQMDFNELMKIQSDQFDFMRNLVEGIVEAAATKEGVKDEVERAFDSQSAISSQRIDTVYACLVEPKLSRQEVVYICKMFPSVGVRLYTAIMNLTNKGADLKKNFQG